MCDKRLILSDGLCLTILPTYPNPLLYSLFLSPYSLLPTPYLLLFLFLPWTTLNFAVQCFYSGIILA